MHGHSDIVYVTQHLSCNCSDIHPIQILGNRHSSHVDCDPCLPVWRCCQNGALCQEEDTCYTSSICAQLDLLADDAMADRHFIQTYKRA